MTENFMVGLPFILSWRRDRHLRQVAGGQWPVTGAAGGPRSQPGIGRTTLPLWFGSMLAFDVLHGLSFFIGPGVSAVGVAVTTISMLTMLFGWVLVVRYRPGGRSKLSRAFGIPSQARQ